MLSIKAVVLAAGILASTAVAPVGADQNVAADKKAQKKKPAKKVDALDAMFKKLDTNNDGKLSPAEFAKLKDVKKADTAKAAKKAKPAKPKKANTAEKGKKKANTAAEVFKKLDTNKDGFLTLAEFKKLTDIQQAAKAAKKAKKAKKNTK